MRAYMDEQDVPKAPKPPKDEGMDDMFAPATDSATSQIAAHDIKHDTLKRRRMAVFATFGSSGTNGYAAFEVANILNCPQHWGTSSIDALKKQGMLEETGRTRENPESKKQCRVLVATQFTTGALRKVVA